MAAIPLPRRRAVRALRLFVLCAAAWCASAACSHARAQVRPGAWRLFLDVDVLGVDWVKTTQPGMPDVRTTVVNLGPNQLGASRLWIPSTPLGLGLGYALKPNWMLDLRAGFGFSALATSGNEPNTTFVAWTFMPGLSWVARGGRAKPYVKFSPLLEFVQVKQGEARQRFFGGCFSAGGGVFLFTAEHVSADVGLFFEGRFPDLDKNAPHAKVQFADARTLVRFGLSMWR